MFEKNLLRKIVLVAAIHLAGCATVKIPNFKAHITLPASGDGYYVKTVTGEEGRIPKEQWQEISKKGIVILSEDWAILRNTVLENCLRHQCDDTVGLLDELFYTLDNSLKKIK